jgi:hypothetical protein
MMFRKIMTPTGVTMSVAMGFVSHSLTVLLVCVAFLLWGVPTQAQTDDDDDDMSGGALAVLLLSVGTAVGDLDAFLPPSSPMHLDRLLMAMEGAADAEQAEDRAGELTWLGKATGAAQALMGATSSCDACGDLRDDLQEILGRVARERARIAGAPRTCNADGIVGKWEECDPLASPIGCESTTDFCNTRCKCQQPTP